MLNGTDAIIQTINVVNETNITINISNILLESKNTNGIEYLSYLVPLIAVIVTRIIAFSNIRSNSRNLFIQIHQKEIVINIKELTEKIQSGDRKKILIFLDSVNSIYIPISLKNEFKNILNNMLDNDLDSESISNMKELINKYITEQNLFY